MLGILPDRGCLGALVRSGYGETQLRGYVHAAGGNPSRGLIGERNPELGWAAPSSDDPDYGDDGGRKACVARHGAGRRILPAAAAQGDREPHQVLQVLGWRRPPLGKSHPRFHRTASAGCFVSHDVVPAVKQDSSW
jgi:hypothetical protein